MFGLQRQKKNSSKKIIKKTNFQFCIFIHSFHSFFSFQIFNSSSSNLLLLINRSFLLGELFKLPNQQFVFFFLVLLLSLTKIWKQFYVIPAWEVSRNSSVEPPPRNQIVISILWFVGGDSTNKQKITEKIGSHTDKPIAYDNSRKVALSMRRSSSIESIVNRRNSTKSVFYPTKPARIFLSTFYVSRKFLVVLRRGWQLRSRITKKTLITDFGCNTRHFSTKREFFRDP